MIQGDAVGDGAAGEVVVEPVHVAADVGDAGVQAKRLGDVEAVLLVEAEADRVGQHRLGGPEIDLEAGGDADALQGQLAFVGSESDLRLVGRFAGRRGGNQEGEEQTTEDDENAEWLHGWMSPARRAGAVAGTTHDS